jgi:mannosyltransferase
MAEVFVTNFNSNFTGVSATAANVIAGQEAAGHVNLVGHPLPGCKAPISVSQARVLSSKPTGDHPFHIWHVRRNTEMRAAIWARDVMRLPIKIVFTSAAQRLHSWFPRQLISRMDAIIATTPKAAEFVPNVKAVVSHGVDMSKFFPSQDREAEWKSLGFGGKFGIAAVGRVRTEKGTDRFVDTMIHVLGHHPTGRGLILGKAGRSDQRFLGELKAKVAHAGLSEKILFLGEIKPERMPEIVRSLHLLVALPRYEGYGMTPLEAMASGTPFVATDTGFFENFSHGGSTGIITNAENAADEINRLIGDPQRHLKMSSAAVTQVGRHHSIAAEVAGINQVYEDLWENG